MTRLTTNEMILTCVERLQQRRYPGDENCLHVRDDVFEEVLKARV